MIAAREDRELSIYIPTRRYGNFEEILKELAQSRVGVKTYLDYGTGDSQRLLLVTDDSDKAVDTLQSAGYRCRTENVVVVQVDGSEHYTAMRVYQVLVDAGVLVISSYLSPALDGPAHVVFHTADNRQAMHILSSSQLRLEN